MTTIGKLLKHTRRLRGLSKWEVEKETKIRGTFIEAIENENWDALPNYPVVRGFVKNIAKFLEVEEAKAEALLRRDYPPKKLVLHPKPDVENKFRWGPRLTFLLGIAFVGIIILGYLMYQYTLFISPPTLEVLEPQEGAIVYTQKVNVKGRTDPEAAVKINNQPVLLNEKGDFEEEIEVSQNTTEIEVVSTSRSGKETIIKRKIEVKP